MATVAVGSFAEVTTTTFTWAPGAVGNLMCIGFGINSYSSGLAVGSISSSNATWAKAVGFANGSSYCEAWYGVATSTSSQTVTVTMHSGTLHDAATQEFSSGLGSGTAWAVDNSNTLLGPTGTCKYPTVTAAAGDTYFGFYFAVGGVNGAGSPAGYSFYKTPSHGNGACYDPSCSSGSQSPTDSGTGPNSGDQVVGFTITPSAGGGAVWLPQPARRLLGPARPPRGRFYAVVPAQVPVPKAVFPNRPASERRLLFELQPKGRQWRAAPPQVPVPAPVFPTTTSSTRRRLFGLQPRGKRPFPVQPQVPVPNPVWPTTTPSTRRRLFALDPRGRRWAPTPPQEPGQPTVTPQPRRRLFALQPRGRRPFPTQPQIPVPATLPQVTNPRGRRMAAQVKGRKYEPPWGQQAAPTNPAIVLPARPPRKLAAMLRRGRQTFPVQPQIPVPPTLPQFTRPRGRRLAGLVKGRSYMPPWGQQAAPVNPAIVLPARPPRRLLAGLRRGRVATPTPPQVPVPVKTPTQQQPRLRLIPATNRGRRTGPHRYQDIPPQKPPAARRRIVPLRFGRVLRGLGQALAPVFTIGRLTANDVGSNPTATDYAPLIDPNAAGLATLTADDEATAELTADDTSGQ